MLVKIILTMHLVQGIAKKQYDMLNIRDRSQVTACFSYELSQNSTFFHTIEAFWPSACSKESL